MVETYAFSGGAKVKAALDEIAARLGKKAALEVGWPEGTVAPDGTPQAAKAMWNEFGTKTIPSRPFFRPMIEAESPSWARKLAISLKNLDNNVSEALEILGQDIAGALAESIRKVDSPPLSPITMMMRKMLMNDSTLGNSDNPVTIRTVAEAAARVAAGEDYSGASDKPLVTPACGSNPGGTMIKSIKYMVKE